MSDTVEVMGKMYKRIPIAPGTQPHLLCYGCAGNNNSRVCEGLPLCFDDDDMDDDGCIWQEVQHAGN